jgi:hypothetical protein
VRQLVGARVVPISANRKVGPVAVTLLAQSTCPSVCPLRGKGCYAEWGPQGIHTAKVNRSRATILDLVEQEAEGIRALPADRPLRLHIVGDWPITAAAKIGAKATDQYIAKGQPVWKYTHAWRNVAREAFGDMSILASCETTDQVKHARARGFAAAVVVDRFETHKKYIVGGEQVIPCPAQTERTKDCTSCRLCWDGEARLRAGVSIAFEAHGPGARRVREVLNG